MKDGSEVEDSPSNLYAERYRVLRQLGEGGMAVVHEVIDERTGRRMTLKTMRSLPTDRIAESAHLFEQEYHALAQLSHPRVVRVFDFSHDTEGLPYYTMELLDGGDLRELAPMPYARVCAVLADICSALSLLHSRRLVHRDLTPRNVRCTRDGLAKLIDFGAVLPFGAHKRIVGTPPFCPPEAVTGQELDGRSDLYSLGATAYFALTGRNAYPARTFAGLRDLWAGGTKPPSAYSPDIPADLDQLVLSLLQQDPMDRPDSAATVLSRLSAIGGFRRSERPAETQAYLSTPSLVGRREELQYIRKLALRTRRGRGGSVLFEGPPGTGATRMLGSAVLEAKLQGLAAVHLTATDAGAGPFSGLRSLTQQLINSMPALAERIAPSQRAALAQLLPNIRQEHRTAHGAPVTRPPAATLQALQTGRREIHEAALALVHAAAKEHPLLLAVDDLDRMDEPTAALLGLLLGGLREHALVLAMTVHSDALQDARGALALIRERAHLRRLSALDEAAHEAMLASIFGAMSSLAALARYLYGITGGVPGATMQLAQHLVDRGVLVLAGGAWSARAGFDEAGLPQSVDEAIHARLDSLPSAAIGLAQALAMVPQQTIHFDELGSLCDHETTADLLGAVDALVAADVLTSDGVYYRLKHRSLQGPLRARVDEGTMRSLYQRLADLFSQRREPTALTTYYLACAGQVERACELLLEQGSPIELESSALLGVAVDERPAHLLEVLEAVVAHAEEKKRSVRDLIILRQWVTVLVSLVTAEGAQHLDAALAQLRTDCGLAAYDALAGQAPEEERLGKALEQAVARHEATPEGERGLHPFDAIKHLARTELYGLAVYGAMLDHDRIMAMPDMTPLTAISPAVKVVHQNILGSAALLAGRYVEAFDLWQGVLDRLAEPDMAGLSGSHHHYMRLAILTAIGTVDSSLCRLSTLARADALAKDRLFEINAERLRMNYACRMGDAAGAERHRRSAELLRLRDNPQQMFDGSHLVVQAQAYAALDDGVRLAQVMPSIERMAARMAPWQAMLELARGHLKRIRNEPEGALEHFDAALRGTRPGHSLVWPYAAAGRLHALRLLGRLDEACAEGPKLVEVARTERLEHAHSIREAWALSLSARGHHEAAQATIAEAISGWEGLQAAGTLLGSALESGARIALAAGDTAGFAELAGRCGQVYRVGRNATLAARHDALLREAQGRLRGEEALSAELHDHTHVDDGLQRILAELPSQEERVKYCITTIAHHTLARSAALFLLGEERLELGAHFGEPPAEDLTQRVRDYLEIELHDNLDATVTGDADVEFATSALWHTATAKHVQLPLLLMHESEDGMRVTAIAVVEVQETTTFVPPTRLLSELSRGLCQAGDSPGHTALG